MDSSFSKALALNGMSTSTAIVVWTMIIFLLALIVGILYFFNRQLHRNKLTSRVSSNKRKEGKGF